MGHLHRDGCVTVDFDDGDKERLNFSNEVWHHVSIESNPSILNAQNGQTSDGILKTVQDADRDELKRLFEFFGNKPFCKHHVQGFEQFVLNNSYDFEEAAFLKAVKVVPRNAVPPGANFISSHTLYRIKTNDDGSYKLKSRISPHHNEDDLRSDLSSDCATCSPAGLINVGSIGSLKKWKVHKANVKSAFLQTGSAARDV